MAHAIDPSTWEADHWVLSQWFIFLEFLLPSKYARELVVAYDQPPSSGLSFAQHPVHRHTHTHKYHFFKSQAVRVIAGLPCSWPRAYTEAVASNSSAPVPLAIQRIHLSGLGTMLKIVLFVGFIHEDVQSGTSQKQILFLSWDLYFSKAEPFSDYRLECSSQDHFEVSDCLTCLYSPLNDSDVYFLVWGCSSAIRVLA